MKNSSKFWRPNSIFKGVKIKLGVQVLSYELMKNVESNKKVDKILDGVKSGDVVLIEGRLSSDEELELTTKALKNVSGKFSGVEIAFLSSTNSKSILEKVKDNIIKILAKDRFGITVVGPSKVIKEIKMDPNKLEILFK
jgi:hypothetical protein